MQQLKQLFPIINGLLKTYRIPGLLFAIFLTTNGLLSVHGQTTDPVTSIRDLKEGYLIVRMPAFKAKIDTLQSMLRRSTDNSSKVRIRKQLNDATEERDTLLADYTRAFRDLYHFSKAGYYFDFEGHDLRIANFYNMDGTPLSKEELSTKPVFYLFFERTPESHIEAMVIYNAEGIKVPQPFPNNFIQGGINFLFLKVSDKKFATWRVDRINKRLTKYWKENREG